MSLIAANYTHISKTAGPYPKSEDSSNSGDKAEWVGNASRGSEKG